jgi:AcrR family transcriptional regulator
MGYRGKVEERARARELRAQSWTLREIAAELGVAKGSVSVWVRDVDFEPRPRNRGHPAGPKHPMRLKKEQQIERCREEAATWVGELSARDLAMFCLGLYAGEGSKTDGVVSMANTNPRYLRALLAWLRGEFDLDNARWRARLYLHEGLDLGSAMDHWTKLLGIDVDQFHKPYRAVADSSIRSRKHVNGCATVAYSDSLLHRRVMARIEAIASRFDLPG